MNTGLKNISPRLITTLLNSPKYDVVIDLIDKENSKSKDVLISASDRVSIESLGRVLSAYMLRDRLKIEELEYAKGEEREKLLKEQKDVIYSLKRTNNRGKDGNDLSPFCSISDSFFKGTASEDSELSFYSGIEAICKEYFDNPIEVSYGKFLDIVVGDSKEGLDAIARIDEIKGTRCISSLHNYYRDNERKKKKFEARSKANARNELSNDMDEEEIYLQGKIKSRNIDQNKKQSQSKNQSENQNIDLSEEDELDMD